jgi:hypothetical protein
MKFTSAIATAIIGFTCVSALPTKGNPNPSEILPDVASIYHTYNGQIEYDVEYARVRKIQGSGDDLTVLNTFYFPEASRGKTCEFVFELDNSPPDYYIRNKPLFDVFESNRIVTESQAQGPTNNLRDRQLGRLEAVEKGNAKVVFTDKGFSFKCPAPGTHVYEYVPTGDDMEISWHEKTDGGYFRYW